MVDRPLQWLGQAFGPLALVLVRATLASTRVGTHRRWARHLTLAKNLARPALVAGFGLWWGLAGLPLNVMVVPAALPMGTNVFMFAQRYDVAQELVTASLTVSSVSVLLTLPLVMWGLGKL